MICKYNNRCKVLAICTENPTKCHHYKDFTKIDHNYVQPKEFKGWAISDIVDGKRKFVYPSNGFLHLRSSARACLIGLKHGERVSPKARVDRIKVRIEENNDTKTSK